MLTSFKTVLTEKKKLADSVFLFRFNLVEPKEIEFIPGQYMMLRVNNLPRLYSITSPNKIKNYLEFVIELVEGGVASSYLSQLNLGDQVIWQGPAGLFRLAQDEATNRVFLATGTGIAPIRSMIKSSIDDKKNIKNYLFWGLRYFEDIYFFDEWKTIEKNTDGNFKFIYCLSREDDWSKISEAERKYFFFGHIQQALEKFSIFNFQFSNNADFYICGSRTVVEALRDFLVSKGVEKRQIFFERF
jgi:NAD(P)H-flavin reductase